MDIKFKIDEFEGPLDLLLHLIKESKMDIFNIEIEKITEQYISFINEQEKMNLEVASEYLILASELIEIKSKMLLPNSKIDSDFEEEDPREDLVQRLIEYQTYKDITKLLEEKELLRRDIHTKIPENINNYIDESITINSDVTLDDLVVAFKKFLERKKESRPLHTKVTKNEISVSSRRREISKLLTSKKRVSFFELFPILSKQYVVATFLAVLEMAKSKELIIKQDKNFDEIICEVPNE